MRIVPLAMCLLALTANAQAQESPLAHADLPHTVETRLNAIINSPNTKQIHGEATVADSIAGDVVVYHGPLTLTGKIGGQLIVIEGNVDFKPGSQVTGDVTVVSGEVNGLDSATVGGTVTLYGEGFGFLHSGRRVYSVNSERHRVFRDDDRRDWGHSTLSMRTAWNYNRVEGLPVEFGPRIETSGRNPTRLEAHATWRTEVGSPFDTDRWGYAVRLEQFMGGKHDLRVGAVLQSVIDPIEDWQLDNNEASLATLVLHEDYRDYFEREGWSAYMRYAGHASGLSATVAYSDEDQHAQPARDPWTVFGDGAWRLQPLIAEGNFRSASASFQYDRRNDEDSPTAGWLIRTNVTRGLGGSLVIPAAFNPISAVAVAPTPIPYDAQFTSGFADARLYRRVSDNGVLAMRVVGGGALGNVDVPPQFQRALGGAGTMPGYSLFSQDCGARRIAVVRNDKPSQSFFPYYGCNQTVMGSIEYRGGFDMHFGGGFDWSDDDTESHHGWNVDSHPSWIVFFDAGRGWASSEAKARGALDTRQLYDAGAGVHIGDFGLYGAVPLTGSDRGMKFFIRLGPRF
jgi:hypothetical protein